MSYGDIVGLEQGRRYAEARLARDIERRRVARERAQERQNRKTNRDTTTGRSPVVSGGAADAGSETAAGAPAEEARVLIHS